MHTKHTINQHTNNLTTGLFHDFTGAGKFIPWHLFITLGEGIGALTLLSLIIGATYIVRKLRRAPSA